MDLAEEIDKHGMKKFLSKYGFDLCKKTINQDQMITCLGLDHNSVANIMQPPGDFARNTQLYKFVEQKFNARELLSALDKTDNGDVIKFLQDKFQGAIYKPIDDEAEVVATREPESKVQASISQSEVSEVASALGKRKNKELENVLRPLFLKLSSAQKATKFVVSMFALNALSSDDLHTCKSKTDPEDIISFVLAIVIRENKGKELVDSLYESENYTIIREIQKELQKPRQNQHDTTDSGSGQPPAGRRPSKKEVYDCKNVRVLFINNKFDDSRRSSEYERKRRLGADRDDQYIKGLFKDTLNMTTKIEENVPSDEIFGILDQFKKRCIKDENDACIIIISTHGGDEPHSLLMNDLECIHLEKHVIQPFGREEFKGFKGPKIFLFNACRPDKSNIPNPPIKFECEDASEARYSDILIGHSTTPLHYSYRGETEGSCYIKFLHDVCVAHYKDREICELLNMVGKEVAEVMESGNCVQITEIRNRLFDKEFYLREQ